MELLTTNDYQAALTKHAALIGLYVISKVTDGDGGHISLIKNLTHNGIGGVRAENVLPMANSMEATIRDISAELKRRSGGMITTVTPQPGEIGWSQSAKEVILFSFLQLRIRGKIGEAGLKRTIADSCDEAGVHSLNIRVQ